MSLLSHRQTAARRWLIRRRWSFLKRVQSLCYCYCWYNRRGTSAHDWLVMALLLAHSLLAWVMSGSAWTSRELIQDLTDLTLFRLKSSSSRLFDAQRMRTWRWTTLKLICFGTPERKLGRPIRHGGENMLEIIFCGVISKFPLGITTKWALSR